MSGDDNEVRLRALAETLSNRMDAIREQEAPSVKPANVVALSVIQCRTDRPAPLSDAELMQVRAMLAEFALIKEGCPTARRLLEGTP